MKTKSRGRQIAQATVLGVLLAGAVAAFLTGAHGRRLLSGGRPDSAEGWLSWGSGESEQEESYDGREELFEQSDFAEELSLPACQDLRDALARLDEARSQLLTAAATDDAQELEAASQRYRSCLRDVRDGLARLRALVDPQVYEVLVDDLIANSNSEGWTWEPSLVESNPGDLDRESSE